MAFTRLNDNAAGASKRRRNTRDSAGRGIAVDGQVMTTIAFKVQPTELYAGRPGYIHPPAQIVIAVDVFIMIGINS